MWKRSNLRNGASERWVGAVVLCILAGCAATPTPGPIVGPAARTPMAELRAPEPAQGRTASDARHVLDRFAYGPRPGDVERVLEEGAGSWFQHQLRADELPDPRADQAVFPYRRALAPPDRLPDFFSQGGSVPEPPGAGSPWERSRRLRKQVSARQLLREVQMAEIVRHIASEYQVREVMVDFWTNHFNVYARKDEVLLLAGDYVQRVLRPGALGRFEDLLIRTAQHPAMLRYLDNASSRATQRKQAKLPGITENYARELLELHTLGIDGGYGQKDVVDVARILTGWTFRPGADGRGYTFVFDAKQHDRGEKMVLGTQFPSGRGLEEGLRLLALLAAHPATAWHVAEKLCTRFVADDPPLECVEGTSQAFLASDGDIKATLTALFESRSFWAPEHRRAKLKTPLEFMLSAVRGLDGQLVGTTELAASASRLGEAPFSEMSPRGRSETAEHWLQSFTLARLEFAHDLAFGKVPGVRIDHRALLASGSDSDSVAATLTQVLLGRAPSPRTASAIEEALADAPDAAARVSRGAALYLSSPEFQWR